MKMQTRLEEVPAASGPALRISRSARLGDEALLVERSRSGDRTATTRLLCRHIQPTRQYFARRVACAADVDDLVQRTLLCAIEALPRIRDGASFTGFVRAIARRLLLRHRRDDERASKRFETNVRPETLMAREPSASASISHEDIHARVQRALFILPEPSARIILLRYWGEQDTVEIAREFVSKPGAVRLRLHRARQEMKRALVASTSTYTDVWPSDDD